MDGRTAGDLEPMISVIHRAEIERSARLTDQARTHLRDVGERLARSRELRAQSQAILLRVSTMTAETAAWLGGVSPAAAGKVAEDPPHADVPEAEAPARSDEPGDRQFAAVHDLIRMVNVQLEQSVDPVDQLATCIRDTIDGGADPYILLGLLLEGIGYAVEQRLTDAKRADAVAAVLSMLRNRLRHNLRR